MEWQLICWCYLSRSLLGYLYRQHAGRRVLLVSPVDEPYPTRVISCRPTCSSPCQLGKILRRVTGAVGHRVVKLLEFPKLAAYRRCSVVVWRNLESTLLA